MPQKKEKPTPPRHTVNTEPSQSMLSRMFTPLTDAPSRMAADFVRDTSRMPEENVWLARGKGFLQGAAQGAGDLMSGMTSPASILTAAVPELMAMRNAGRGVQAARQAMPRINARPTNQPNAIDVTPEFNNADEAFQHYWNKLSKKRGTPEDIPDNRVARKLEMERRTIERRATPRKDNPDRRASERNREADKKIDALQAEFRRKQFKRIK